MVQLYLMQYTYDKSTTGVVSCKSSLQLAGNCCVQHKESCGFLKHVIKPYDNRSHRQFDVMKIALRFFHDESSTRSKNCMRQS